MRAIATWLLLLTASMAFPPGAHGQAQKLPQNLDFKVFRGGSDIGHHRIRFAQQDGALLVDVDINLQVKFAGITVYRYEHTIRETWHDGKLVAVDATTNDDGEKFALAARPEGDRMRVKGVAGNHMVPLGTMATSYWNIAILQQTQLIETQKGRIPKVTFTPRGEETITARGRQVKAKRWVLQGDDWLTVDLWYDASGMLVSVGFMGKGSEVRYVLQ